MVGDLMRVHFRVGLSLLILLAIAGSVIAQRPGGGGRGGNRGGFGGGGFGNSPVSVVNRNADELKLTEEQKEKLNELDDKRREDTRIGDLYSKLRGASESETEKFLAEIRKLTEEQRVYLESQIKEVLSSEQMSRYKQLTRQARGTGSLADTDVSGELKLTPEQIGKLKELSDENDKRSTEFFKSMQGGGGRGNFEELRKEFEEKRLSVLTDEQRGKWKEMLGPDAAAEVNAPGALPSGGGSSNSSRFTRRAMTTDTDSASSQATSEGSTTRKPVVSFGKSADDLLASRSETDSGEKSAEANPDKIPSTTPPKETKMSFNFRHAPWTDVLRRFAEIAGLTLDLNVVPPGTFNYLDDKEYTATQALDVINGYLLQKGFVLVRRDQFLVVINIDDGIPPNLIPNVTVEELAQRGKNELMNVILPIDGITAEEAAEEAKELIGPQGSVTALKRASAISVTDIGSNLRRIHRFLTGINAAPTDLAFRSFDLKHIDALDAEVTVRRLLGLSVGFESVSDGISRNRDRGDSRRGDDRDRQYTPPPTAAKSKAQVATDERTNRLLITASTAEMKIIEDTLKAIDVADEPGANGTRRVRNREPFLEVYSVRTADVMEVAKTLGVLFPGCVVNEDGKTRRLHIHGTPAQHENISRMIKQLDGEGGGGINVAVLPTGRIDALTATSTLHSLFAAEKDAAPSIQPHPTGSGIIVRGTKDQVDQVKLLLSQLDPNALAGNGPKGTLRTVPLMGRDPEEFSRLLEQVWRSRNSNPIRIVPIDSKPVRDLSVPSAERRDSSTSAQPRRSKEVPARDISDRSPAPPKSKRIEAGSKPNGIAEPRPSKNSGRTTSPTEPRAKRSLAVPVFMASLQTTDESPAAEKSDSDTTAKKKKGKAAKKKKKKKNGPTIPLTNPSANKPDQPASSTEPQADAKPQSAGTGDPILIVPSGGNLVIKSDDEGALDDLEKLIEVMQEATPSRPRWSVFYLRTADAGETAAMLERLLPSSSVSSSSVSSGGMLGELTGGMSSMGRSLMSATGLNNVGVSHLTLRIVPEVRSNALYVSGPPDQVREVKLMLQVLDADETPEQLRERAPHFIELEYADVEEVATIIKEVYKDDMLPEGQQPGQQFNPLQMFMGGGGGNRSNSNKGGNQQARTIKLLLTTDTRTNKLIVSASESLFRQIEALAFSLDDAARDANRTVRVIDLKGANSSAVQSALGAMHSKIKVSSSSSRSRSSSTSSAGSSSGSSSSGSPPAIGGFPGFMPFGGPPSGSSSSGGSSDDMRRMFEQRIRERMGGDSGGRPSPGR